MGVLGKTEPRLYTKPLRELTEETSLGFLAIRFATECLHIELLPWQKWLLIHIFELLPDGSLRFRHLIIEVARQNGKTVLAVVICLFRMFVDKSSLVLGTAQNLETSESTWEDALAMIQGSPELSPHLVKICSSIGKKSIKLDNGAQYKVLPATRKSRGKSADTVILDELREHENWDAWSAISSTALARANALVIGISNAGDAKSVVLRAKRKEGIEQIDKGTSLGYFGWSASEEMPIDDPETWAYANPSLGYTISEAALRSEFSKGETVNIFKTENLCMWVDAVVKSYISIKDWERCGDEQTAIRTDSTISLGVDVSANRAYTSIVAAGWDEKNKPSIEVVACRAGMLWVADYVEKLCQSQPVAEIAIQARGCPASELIDSLMERGLPVRQIQGNSLGAATGQIRDLVESRAISHRNQAALGIAVQGGLTKKIGDNDVWNRSKSDAVDIAPLVAATWAVYALRNPNFEPVKVSAYTDMSDWWVKNPSDVDSREKEWWE